MALDSYRIGPQMTRAVSYIQDHPGCSKREVSIAVGPHGSNAYGWNTIQRCLKAGILIGDWMNGRWYMYTPEQARSMYIV